MDIIRTTHRDKEADPAHFFVICNHGVGSPGSALENFKATFYPENGTGGFSFQARDSESKICHSRLKVTPEKPKVKEKGESDYAQRPYAG